MKRINIATGLFQRHLILPKIVAVLLGIFLLSSTAVSAADTTSQEVFFPRDLAILDSSARSALDGIMPPDTFTVLTDIRIYAYTGTGENDPKGKLSIERIKAVRDYLVSTGLSASIISSPAEKPAPEAGTGPVPGKVLILIQYEARIRSSIIIEVPRKKGG